MDGESVAIKFPCPYGNRLLREKSKALDTAYFLRYSGLFKWSRCRDLNPGPFGPEPNALPNCATPRHGASSRT
jgi:hypothetical protein